MTKITQLFYILYDDKDKFKSRRLFPIIWFYILFSEINVQRIV